MEKESITEIEPGNDKTTIIPFKEMRNKTRKKNFWFINSYSRKIISYFRRVNKNDWILLII